MSWIAFFPWLEAVNEAQEVGPYRLVPYVRGKLPGNTPAADQSVLDQLLSSYFDRGNEPIRKCTLIQLKEKESTADITPDEVSAMFTFSELVSISALSARQYFNQLGSYCNRDLFRLIVQRFEHTRAVSITTRRRDGNTQAVWTSEAYRVYRPEHVHRPMKFEIHGRLLTGLLAGSEKLTPKTWERILETILNFNLANTDSSFVSEGSEMMLICGAIERILLSESNEYALATRFSTALVPADRLPYSEFPRLPRQKRLKSFKHATSVRDIWIRDFFRLRGTVAHGHRSVLYPSVWSLQEHLLLASFVFPLLLKLNLKAEGLYEISGDDKIFIENFEKLCAADLFKVPNPGEEWPWNEILGEAFVDKWIDDQTVSDA